MPFTKSLSFAPLGAAPCLSAGNVVLRAHKLTDFNACWAFAQSPRAQYAGAGQNPTHLWYGLGSEIASWQLQGFGSWCVDVDNLPAGLVAITQPPHFPEIELSWTMFDGFEGRGIAAQAADLASKWFWSIAADETLVSYIHPENARSIALATRLGATLDSDAANPEGYVADTKVYRHRRPA